jgi:hypothetical protein
MSKTSKGSSEDELTHPTPVKAMCDPVFRLIGVWNDYLVDMKDFRIMRITTTVIDVHMPPHRRAHQVAQHGSTIIVRREFTSTQLDASPIRAIDGPSCTRHRPMAGLMLLLGMS